MPKSLETDLSKSLDELERVDSGDANDAPTQLVRDVIRSRQKPLNSLSLDEIGRLVVHLNGCPFILDLVIPLLESDPLIDGGYYPGDILSSLVRADPSIWEDRPGYSDMLVNFYRRALSSPFEEKEAFLESLGIENPHNPN